MLKIKRIRMPDIFRFHLTLPFFKFDVEMLQYHHERRSRNIFVFRITLWKWNCFFELGKKDV
jgi:hypothetical protein